MIKPTVGRVVWYYPHGRIHPDDLPRAAIIAHVHSDTCVNIGFLDRDGDHYSATSVPLRQDGGITSLGSPFCEWMPHQWGQAAKAEAAIVEHDVTQTALAEHLSKSTSTLRSNDEASVTRGVQTCEPALLQPLIDERAVLERRMREMWEFTRSDAYAGLSKGEREVRERYTQALYDYIHAITTRIVHYA